MRTKPGSRLILLLALLLAPLPGRADSHILVLSGLGGEQEFRDIFHRWSITLVDAAQRAGIAAENITYLGEDWTRDPERISARSDKENIKLTLNELQKKVRPGDDVYIFMFGHGSLRGRQVFFNIAGPDLSAEEFAALLTPFGEQRLIIVNTTSSSGPFVRALSAPGRVVITATSKATERYFPEFGGYFVDALDQDDADSDKDNRVSILEAFNFAKLAIKREYDSDKRLLTEHALLDDNADKSGSREPDALAQDGAIAALIYPFGERKRGIGHTADNPRVAALLETKSALEERILALKRRKSELQEDEYYASLEALLLDLARNLKARQEASLASAGVNNDDDANTDSLSLPAPADPVPNQSEDDGTGSGSTQAEKKS